MHQKATLVMLVAVISLVLTAPAAAESEASVEWSVYIDNAPSGADVAVNDGTVYIATSKSLAAVDIASQEREWKRDNPTDTFDAPGIDVENGALLVEGDDIATIHNASTGRLRFQTTAGLGKPIEHSGAAIYTVTHPEFDSTRISSLDPQTGVADWSTDLDADIGSILADETGVYGATGEAVYRLSTDGTVEYRQSGGDFFWLQRYAPLETRLLLIEGNSSQAYSSDIQVYDKLDSAKIGTYPSALDPDPDTSAAEGDFLYHEHTLLNEPVSRIVKTDAGSQKDVFNRLIDTELKEIAIGAQNLYATADGGVLYVFSKTDGSTVDRIELGNTAADVGATGGVAYVYSEGSIKAVKTSNNDGTPTPTPDPGTPTPTPNESGVSLSFQPAAPSVSPSGTTTVAVQASGLSDGVGSYEMHWRLDNTDVATIQSIEPEGTNASDSLTTVSVSGGKATISAGSVDTIPDDGTLATLTIAGNETGTTTLENTESPVIGTDGAQNYDTSTTPATITVSPSTGPPSVVPGGNPPTSVPAGDGNSTTTEDVNGNGAFDVVDVQALFENQNSDAVQNNPAYFDFNGNGDFDVVDVQRLFQLAQSD